jgi:hypothetical protein
VAKPMRNLNLFYTLQICAVFGPTAFEKSVAKPMRHLKLFYTLQICAVFGPTFFQKVEFNFT